MVTETQVRQDARKLVKMGIAQKTIADAMAVSPHWFSRWLRQKRAGALKVSDMNGFYEFVRRLRAVLDQIDQSRSGRPVSPTRAGVTWAATTDVLADPTLLPAAAGGSDATTGVSRSRLSDADERALVARLSEALRRALAESANRPDDREVRVPRGAVVAGRPK